jgi:hypothetical protein
MHQAGNSKGIQSQEFRISRKENVLIPFVHKDLF